MPRILVADDNSNIQKMVALALKEAGIDVIAVGNGEAAVRKMPEVNPDLVLADIFMPVRNGYEVCEFVKRDPRYAQTPVILLVGAFDPFDEREAQRVHADGVLKKPFVPPEPLINMVKGLLAKAAGERLVAVTVPAAGAASARPSGAASVPIPLPEIPRAEFSDAPAEEAEEFTPPEKVDWNQHEQPVAFSSLLEAPATATEEPEAVVTAARDPILGEPAFWSQPAPAEEGEAEGASEESPWGVSRDRLPRRDGALRDAVGIDEGFASADLAIAQPELTESSSAFAPSPGTFASSEGTAEDTLPMPELSPEVSLEELPVPEEPVAPSAPELPADPIVNAALPLEEAPLVAPVEEASGSEALAMGTVFPADNTAMDLALSLPAPIPETAPKLAEEIAAGSPAEPWTTWPPAFIRSARQRDTEPAEPVAQIVVPPAAASSSPPASAPDPELVAAIVERVMERMRPKVIELVTREILRPVVEALVQRELEKR